MFPLEVCIDSLQSALAAAPYLRKGDRFEVCGSLLAGGGTTPSIGLVNVVKARLPDIELMVMIRPRPGSFVYSPCEVEVMIADIHAARQAGALGVVFGCLKENGQVDVEITRKLVDAAQGMEVTFHRAFDVTPEWKDALDAIVSLDISRLLTSGHALTAVDGAHELDEMTRHLEKTGSNLVITPASGISSATLVPLLERAPLLKEAHFSASSAVFGPQTDAMVAGAKLGFGKGTMWTMHPKKVKDMRELVDSIEGSKEGRSDAQGAA